MVSRISHPLSSPWRFALGVDVDLGPFYERFKSDSLIGASLRPHKGFGEALAHRTLATGIMSIAVNLHEPVDVTEWLLYVNPSIWAGRGLGQGEGHVFTQDGTLVASYTCQAMIRGFNRPPEAMGKDWSNAM